jgi:hypothetical protein
MFKRNQVEQAIGQILEPRSAKLSSTLRSRIRRLLETDRRFSRSKRSTDPGRKYFFRSNMPGRGAENWFSEYEAFALLTGLRLMQHAWPQGFVVALLRRVRPELEKEHTRISTQGSAGLFDQQVIQQRAKSGDMAVQNTDPVFLGIISADPNGPRGSNPAAICRGQQRLLNFLRTYGDGSTLKSYELLNSARALSGALAETRPRKRGRTRE